MTFTSHKLEGGLYWELVTVTFTISRLIRNELPHLVEARRGGYKGTRGLNVPKDLGLFHGLAGLCGPHNYERT